MPEPSNSANGAMLSVVPSSIETASGLFVDLADPDPATIRLADIAQAMALTCRYGGHINRFYSVAEHAVLVHDLLAYQDSGHELRLAGLFHDAAEAYLGDVVAPLKYALRVMDGRPVSVYDRLSDQMDAAIATRYGVDEGALNSRALRVADMWALRIEARELTHTGGEHWRWPGELPLAGEKPAHVEWFGGRSWEGARDAWLRRAGLLSIQEVRDAA